MRLPDPRGETSAALVDLLREHAGVDGHAGRLIAAAERAGSRDPLTDEDFQLTLTVMYELHYRGFDDVDDDWEWNPGVLQARSALEAAFERAVRERVRALPDVAEPGGVEPEEVPGALFELTGDGKRPALASYLARHGTVQHYREMLQHRSVYHLKEADPHTWTIPRLAGRAKAAMVEVQADEYGGGRAERMHATLFATTLRELGLDDEYGAYLDVVPATTLATGNLISLFGLHRRLRGAAVGHLAAFEMTSCQPNRLYGNGLRRLGFGPAATRFFDEHVEADAVHEQIAAHDLAGDLVRVEPSLTDDVLLGAAACLLVDGAAGKHLLESWCAGRSSLLDSGFSSVGTGAA